MNSQVETHVIAHGIHLLHIDIMMFPSLLYSELIALRQHAETKGLLLVLKRPRQLLTQCQCEYAPGMLISCGLLLQVPGEY